METGQQLRAPRSIMNKQTLERIGNELSRLCDNVERHGLVDYQMGAAEDDILSRESLLNTFSGCKNFFFLSSSNRVNSSDALLSTSGADG